MERADAAWRDAGLSPPAMSTFAELGVPADQVPDLVDYLVSGGRLLRVSTEMLVHAEAFARLLDGLRALFAEKDAIAVGDVGQRLDVSRKYSVPILELCDRLGYTERRESERRRGPKL
ncbi:MAG: SelB C-terminal domain-containing protein [Candidatus Latescibacteria bacterium]|nr:SelB C-terminal domain-containing protein [Candidatus Latescibacterota bacterium]